ncbi:MAG: hypothetical protein IPJ85_05200 [Flavobacteriales bacterium]|nr:hypothetical protein [Flavobacteriales bacterium]
MSLARAARLTLAIAPVLWGCSGMWDDEDPIVARAFDRQLRWSELRLVIPISADPVDSAAMAEAYVDNWLRQQVELHHAELNLEPSRKEFETELRDYRNSLLLFAFEEELVRQRLDTVISEGEIEAYYQANSHEFDLTDDLLRARWFVINTDDRKAFARIKDRFLSGKDSDMREVEIALVQRGIAFTDRTAQWLTAVELRNEVPIDALPSTGPDGKRMVWQADDSAWFLDIIELRPRHAPAPIEIARHDIRTILLNRRKTDLVARMRQDLYENALAAKQAERL